MDVLSAQDSEDLDEMIVDALAADKAYPLPGDTLSQAIDNLEVYPR